MPKTWNKSYGWIFEHKTKLKNNYEKISKKADKVEKQQDNALKEINFKIDQCQNQLANQYNEIVPNQNDLQAQKDELHHNIARCTKKHKKYTNNQKEAEIEEWRNENIIYTQTENIKINEQTKMNYINIRDKMVEASQYVNKGVSKLQSKIDYHEQLSDLKSDIKSTNINIEKQENILKSQNKSIKDNLNIQIEQTQVGMNGASKSHIDSINNCWQFIKQSEHQINTIHSVCDKIKNNKMPKYDESRLNKCEEKRRIAIKELKSIRSEYMRLWRLVSNISKDKQKIESSKVSSIPDIETLNHALFLWLLNW